MVIFDKDFYDFLQSMGIAYSHSKMSTLEDRVERLEKLVYELYKEIKKIKADANKEIEKKDQQERIAKREKEEKYRLNDHVIISEDLTINGKTIKKGSKGIIDNILTSYYGISYIIKLDEDELEIQIPETSFEIKD